MKKKTKTVPTDLSGYQKKMKAAIKKLGLATYYAEDGAQLSAIRCAAEGIVLLLDAKAQRDSYIASGIGKGKEHNVERVKVHGSSTIESRGYDEDKHVLEVAFINRKSPEHPNIYQYAAVPQSVWTDWLQSASAGSFFAAQIKGHYLTTRIQ